MNDFVRLGMAHHHHNQGLDNHYHHHHQGRLDQHHDDHRE